MEKELDNIDKSIIRILQEMPALRSRILQRKSFYLPRRFLPGLSGWKNEGF